MDCSWSQATAFNFFLIQPPFFRTFYSYSLIFLDFFCLVRSVLLFHSFFKFPPSLGHLPHLAPWLSLGIIDPSLVPLPQAPCCLHGPPLGPCLAGEQLLPFGYNNKPQSTPNNNNIIFTIPTSNHHSNNNNNIDIIYIPLREPQDYRLTSLSVGYLALRCSVGLPLAPVQLEWECLAFSTE